MDLKTVQEYTQSQSNMHKWGEQDISIRLAYLHSEVKEATNEILGIELATHKKELIETKEKLGLELFDIIWNVADIANRYGVDLTASAEQKMLINTNRSFSKSPYKDAE